ncbi:MAG: phosphoglucomutase, alpha-D-glucose phosphate-specific, partial [Nitriliruptoraceae bacterium]
MLDVDDLLARYHDERPDPADPAQRVAFGTSGHRGSSLTTSFNEAHILATTEAICRERAARKVTGPLFLGRDTHALSAPATETALQVLAAHGVEVRIDDTDGYTPTPVISHAILTHNRDHPDTPADGIVVTPSHNPPEDGGFKYNPAHGGPADSTVTGRIERVANELLADPDRIRRVPLAEARA